MKSVVTNQGTTFEDDGFGVHSSTIFRHLSIYLLGKGVWMVHESFAWGLESGGRVALGLVEVESLAPALNTSTYPFSWFP